MTHRILDLGFELLARFWPVALVCCILAFILVVMLAVRRIGGKSGRQDVDFARRGVSKYSNSVMNSLRRLPEDQYLCFHEVFVPRLDGEFTTRIHHVILSPYGIFVLQVQHERGEISGAADDREWVARQQDDVTRFTNPTIRNSYHVKALAKFLDLSESLFHSIVIFGGEVCFEMTPPRHVLTVGIGREITSHTAVTIAPEVLKITADKLREQDVSTDVEARRMSHSMARNNRLKHTCERVK